VNGLAWTAILVAVTIEPVMALALREAQGFTKPWPTTLALAFSVAALGLVSFAMKSLPIGTAYAVFVGLGAAAVAVTGVVALGESLAATRVISILLILVGVVGLKFGTA
jgi:quaternary ammonium compound-resistance protein SugE